MKLDGIAQHEIDRVSTEAAPALEPGKLRVRIAVLRPRRAPQPLAPWFVNRIRDDRRLPALSSKRGASPARTPELGREKPIGTRASGFDIDSAVKWKHAMKVTIGLPTDVFPAFEAAQRRS